MTLKSDLIIAFAFAAERNFAKTKAEDEIDLLTLFALKTFRKE